jgi:hypothetical protein
MRFVLALTLTLALEGAAGAAVFTEENGYCSNAANAFKTADMTLSSCEQLCETTPGCFDGYFCGSANCGGAGAGMVCSSTFLFAFFFSLPIPSCLKTSPGDSIQKGGNALVRGGLKFEGNQYKPLAHNPLM